MTTWRDGVGREVSGGAQEGGDTSKPVADSC